MSANLVVIKIVPVKYVLVKLVLAEQLLKMVIAIAVLIANVKAFVFAKTKVAPYGATFKF